MAGYFSGLLLATDEHRLNTIPENQTSIASYFLDSSMSAGLCRRLGTASVKRTPAAL
jgi:hypothetical protein